MFVLITTLEIFKNSQGVALVKKIIIVSISLIFTCMLHACLLDNSSNGEPGTRSFYLGFTPWPYAATLIAIDNVYNFINTEGDIIAHHFQQGVPFTADPADFSSYNQSVKDEINGRITGTSANKTIFLAIDSLNGARDDLTDLWDSSGNMARPSPWDTRGFADANVITAYINFSKVIINKFINDYGKEPTYFNYGTEVSDLMINDAAKFTEYITFAQQVYTNLKATYPNMKLMVSIALKTPGSTEMNTVQAGFAQIKNYVDVVGISTYGYAFYAHANKGNPDNLPSNWLTQIQTIAPNKQYAVTETGWIAENLSIPAYSLNVSSNSTSQNNYMKKLFQESNDTLNAEFIIWYTSYDYDTLWTDTLGSDDLSKIWKDTGLIDESFAERTALSTWREWKQKSKR
jgi:hypothetical protein